MSNIVFDIETSGFEFDTLSDSFQEYILKFATTKEEEKTEKEKLGLWSLTGEIVTIALIFEDSKEGYVFFQTPEENIEPFEKENIKYVPGSEKNILKNFWNIIKNCDKFITFNGRRFDCPFILIRSAINKIKAKRDLMPHRYSVSNHIDLLDQLTFYGAVRKKFPLDLWCRAFGIDSPKQECSGENVHALFKQKEFLDIANYCISDVKATLKLYRYWNKYINI